MNYQLALRGTVTLALLTTMLLGAVSLFNSNANAQNEKPSDAASRYVVSSWAYPATHTPNGHGDAQHGAYIIDSATGEVWSIVGNGKLHKIGGVR